MSESPTVPFTSSRVWIALILILLGITGAIGYSVWSYWNQSQNPPPDIDLTRVDPEVGTSLREHRQAVLANPRSAESWGKFGMFLRAHDFASEANACFVQAERRDPREPRWPYFRGLTLVLTEPQQGLECLRRAVALLDGSHLAPSFRLAEVLIEQGEFAEAREVLDRARALAPDHLRGQLLQARLALAEQDWQQALKLSERCLRDPRSTKKAHLVAAEATRRLGQLARTEQLLQQANQLPEDQPWPDTLVAEVEQMHVGIQAKLVKAESLEREGRIDDALKLLDRLIRDYPNDFRVRTQLAALLRRAGQLNAAERLYEESTRLAPDDVDSWFNLSIVQYFLNKKREAVESLRKVTARKPDHTLAYHNLGICLKDLGDRDGARKAWEQALRCQPSYEPARKALAELEDKSSGNKKP